MFYYAAPLSFLLMKNSCGHHEVKSFFKRLLSKVTFSERDTHLNNIFYDGIKSVN